MSQKTKTYRNAAYLAWLRTQPCCITGYTDMTHIIEAAHVRRGNGGGMGLKPSDYRAIPLEQSQHRWQHQVGERCFWFEKNRKDPDLEIIIHLSRYIGDTKDIIKALELFIEGRRSAKTDDH